MRYCGCGHRSGPSCESGGWLIQSVQLVNNKQLSTLAELRVYRNCSLLLLGQRTPMRFPGGDAPAVVKRAGGMAAWD